MCCVKKDAETSTEPLSGRRLFQTNDLDEARQIVASKFCDHRLEIRSNPELFDATYHRAEGQNASLNFIRYGADVTIEPGELGSFYLIQLPIAGYANIVNGTEEVQSSRHTGSVLNPHRPTQMRWHSGCAQLLLQIDACTLKRHAEKLLGEHLNAPVTFETQVDTQRNYTSKWVRKLKTCFHLAEHNALFSRNKLSTQMLAEDNLMTEFLLTQPSDISHRFDKSTFAARHALVAKALRYVSQHFRDALTVNDIAEAVGVSARRLQQAFREELGQSPMQYIKKRRLFFAKALLNKASHDTTISDICHQAGFSHLGRFSIEYRKQFGEKPSDTLRRETIATSNSYVDTHN